MEGEVGGAEQKTGNQTKGIRVVQERTAEEHGMT
jgi:hypothetical protein